MPESIPGAPSCNRGVRTAADRGRERRSQVERRHGRPRRRRVAHREVLGHGKNTKDGYDLAVKRITRWAA